MGLAVDQLALCLRGFESLSAHMKLYHGSKYKLEKLKSRQASSVVVVPEKELLDAIYLTPDYGFAIACAARPDGVSNIDGKEKTIEFENPENFDPLREIYIYTVDSDKITAENLIKVDDGQYAVIGLEELEYDSVELKTANEVQKYYRLLNWKGEGRQKEIKKELKFK